MQLACPQCGRMLEAPLPLPAQAKCPFCAAVFAPSPPPLPNPYQAPMAAGVPLGAPMAPPVPANTAQLTAPAICLLITGVLWAGIAALNWMSMLSQDKPPPPIPIFGGDPNAVRGMEIGFQIVRYLGWVFVLMGAMIALGAVQMLTRRSYALAMTGSIMAMLPCSLCCALGVPFGIWSLIVLNKPEVRAMFP